MLAAISFLDLYITIGGPDSVGFTTLRRGDTIESRLCNSSYSTSLTWACDGLHHWNPQSPDATSFITSVVGRSIDDCFVSVAVILIIYFNPLPQ